VRAAGVNRISLARSRSRGDAGVLAAARAEDVAETALLRAHGFENINIDLMFALPGKLAGWDRRSRRAGLPPGHVRPTR